MTETIRTESQCILEAELRERFAGDPIARMMLAQHSLDESGQCSDCTETVEDSVSGYEYEIDAPAWPCWSVRCVVFAAAGWEAEDVNEVQRRLNNWSGVRWDERGKVEDWVVAGIPGRRASNYARLHIPLSEAQAIEARAALDGTDLDATLDTLVALRAPVCR